MPTPKKKSCPICNKSDLVIPIVFGMPSGKLFQEAEVGKVHLGGCCIMIDDKKMYYCKRDDIEF